MIQNSTSQSKASRLVMLALSTAAFFAVTACPTFADTHQVWEKVEIALYSAKSYENPYTDVEVWADLIGPGFNKRCYGFWDGDRTFRIRVMATAPGTWKWTTGSNQGDEGLNGKTGEFAAVDWDQAAKEENPCRRGMIRATANGHAFEYADGTPFFLLGDTWWATPTFRFRWYADNKERPIGPAAGFKDYVKFRRKQGFNCFAMIAAFPNWANDGKPARLNMDDKTVLRAAWQQPGTQSAKDMHDEDGNRAFFFPGKIPGFEDVFPDIDRLNPRYFQNMDKKIDYLNANGIVPFIEVSRRDIGQAWKKFYDWPDSYTRYIQYIWSRYQANICLFSPIHFDTSSATIPAADWNEAANKVIDKYSPPPFGTMAGTNSNPSSLHNYGHVDKARWLTFHQIGNRRTHNYYAYLTEIFNTEPAVPGINGEPYYAGMNDAPGQTPTSDLYCRSGMYGSVLSGGLGGHIYGAGGWDGGLWGGNVEDAADNHIWAAMKWQSAGQMHHLAAFVMSEGRKYMQLVPKRELLQPNESGKTEGFTGWAYCARTEEKNFFLLYFEKDCPRAALSGARPEGRYSAQWFNPQTGDFSDAGTLSADSSGNISLPGFPDSSGISKADWGLKLTLSNTQSSPAKQRATEILQACDIKGGLIVQIGCGDGRLTAALRANESFLVQALDTTMRNVNAARKYLQSLGLYGPVTVDVLTGDSLPYVDNLVNLVVSEDLGPVGMDEVMRVLAPNGKAYIKDDGVWKKTVKPRPEQIDEWTHFLHNPTNNAVSNDSLVGPPEQLQWLAGPSWARSHDHLASVSAAVSSGDKLFYIEDEGPIAAIVLEPNWYLLARDAFSGVLLWKRPIRQWQLHLRAFRTGPSDLSRRLVAVGDKVYVTLDIDGPLSCLDAATGKTLRTYEQTEGTLEVVCSESKLFVVAGDAESRQAAERAERRGQKSGFTQVLSQRPAYLENPPYKRIVVLDADTGRVLWKKANADTNELMPTTLAISNGRVFFENADEVICLNAQSGDNLWRAARPVSRSRPTWSAPTLVVYGDVVLSADREVAEEKTLDKDSDRKVEWIVSAAGGQSPVGELIAFSAKDGKRLWSCKSRECYNAPVDCLVADGLVWTGSLVKAGDPGITEGRDPATGQVKRTRPEDKEFFTAGMNHHRCYRNKATNEYLVLGRSGVEFIDLQTGEAIPNHWVRGVCQYGVMPCNGLLYAPQDSCACFITAKLNGFKCLAPKPKSSNRDAYQSQGRREERLEKGPAFALIMGKSFYSRPADDWPTYRHDNARSGCTPAALPAELRPEWKVSLGGRLSSITVAEGKLFVAQIDQHIVHALDSAKGREIWSFTAGGRIDSPPTISEGRVLFGSADGWVYCLRASDGALAWRFRAAPQDRRIVSYEQIESLWPVNGSVLVRNGVVYCAAGRSSYLGGGIHLCRIEVETGRLLSETTVDDRDPETGYQKKDVVRGTNIPGALPDVLSCDNGSVYMRHRRFDLMGQEQPPEATHLFSAAGFLDDTWWHRTYWLMGTNMGTSYGGWPNVGNIVPAGRLLVVDDSTVYGFGRNQYIHHGAHVGIDGATVFHYKPDRDSERRFTNYQAFAIDRNENADQQQAKSKQKRTNAAQTTKTYRWTEQLPLFVRAMVLAKDTLFMAGHGDIFTNDEPAAALQGRKGGLLLVLSTADGGKLAQYDLESPPVFDGMVVADECLYMTNIKGDVVCLHRRN